MKTEHETLYDCCKFADWWYLLTGTLVTQAPGEAVRSHFLKGGFVKLRVSKGEPPKLELK